MFIIAFHQKTGGQILKPGDNLYLSPLQTSSESPRRGGIPLVFRQFGNSGKLQKHGFARNAPWTLLQEIVAPCGDQNSLINYELLISSKDYKDWPYDARLALKCNYQQNQALVILEIQNSGTSSFSWTGGLHPYFAFDLLNTEVHGLYAASQQYLYRPSEYFQGKPSLRFDRNAYECLFNTNNSLHVTTPTRTLTLSYQWRALTSG